MAEIGRDSMGGQKSAIPAWYNEDNLVMISALQHYLFCPRRCALVHIEQLWQENRFTVEGCILHERVHGGGRESRRTMRVEFDVPIRSLRLGLVGRADIVEFHRQEDGAWGPLPVEYKRGKPKKDNVDKVQLCAQAICLEEMLNCNIPEGTLYYGEKKRRTVVVFDDELRAKTVETAEHVHALLHGGITPPPHYNERCESCSLFSLCLPKVVTKKRVKSYLRKMVTP